MAGSAERPVIAISDIDGNDPVEVAEFYRRVLAPHFPLDELEPLESFAAEMKAGGTTALAARTPDAVMVGGAVGDWFPGTRVMLLSYLAVAPAGRGAGTGGLLMKALTEAWSGQFSPRLLVMEVEDPRYHHGDVNFGDPEARVRFYERAGARVLPVPYFQPALGSRPGARRVPHLMLMVFGGTEAPPGTQQVDGQIVADFVTEYVKGCEGAIGPDDTELERLLAACRRPGGLPLVRASELPDFG